MNNNLRILRLMSNELIENDHEMSHLNDTLIELIGGLSIIDLDGVYVSVNEKYAETCGYKPEELVGQKWITTVYPEDIPIADKCYEDMVKNGRSMLTFRGVKKDGTIFSKDIILIEKINASGKLIGHYCFMAETPKINLVD